MFVSQLRWCPVAIAVVLGCAVPSPAAVDPARVKEAIAKGAEFLKRSHGGDANFQPGNHAIGTASLSGMAMLEGGIDPADPVIVAAANFVRNGAMAETKTYHVALAVLFLDRLGDPKDIPLIQILGVRLYGGMTAAAGWTYDTGFGLTGQEAERVLAALGRNELSTQPQPAPAARPQPREKPKKDTGFPTPTARAPAADQLPETGKLHAEAARYFLFVRQTVQKGRTGGEGDNSNTQFGLIGLWVATKHGVPADDALAAIEARFIRTQNRDAGWSYSGGGESTAAMTCAGLLGLAVGVGRGQTQTPQSDPEAKPKDPADPFFNPPPPKAKDKPAGDPAPGVVGSPQKKVATAAALRALGMVLRGARQAGSADGINMGAGNLHYLLWSLERVAVAYSLTTIGDVDWYDWGAGILLPAQAGDGSWQGSYGGTVDTSFAILFLCRSNFTKDLSSKLSGQHVDPGTAELRGGSGIPLFTAATGKPAAGTTAKTPAGVAADPPPAPAAAGNAAADTIAEGLLTAKDDFAAKLGVARDARGGDYTTALVRTIPLLSGDRQKQAREALAERLTRMTAATLRAMMKDADAELRRGAALAAAMKDDAAHVPDLIERLADPADTVVRAARAGLKSLTSQDFGPEPGADDAAKKKAAADWKAWFDARPK